MDETIASLVDQLAEEKSKKGLFDRVATVTSLIAALAAFVGAAISFNASVDAAEKQKEIDDTQVRIEKNQKLINARQVKIDENSRLSRLSATTGCYCPQIPTDEDSNWESYVNCTNAFKVSKKSSDDGLRLYCAQKVTPCNGELKTPINIVIDDEKSMQLNACASAD